MDQNLKVLRDGVLTLDSYITNCFGFVIVLGCISFPKSFITVSDWVTLVALTGMFALPCWIMVRKRRLTAELNRLIGELQSKSDAGRDTQASQARL